MGLRPFLFLPCFLVLLPFFTEVCGRGVLRRSSPREVQFAEYATSRRSYMMPLLRAKPQERKGKMA
jgi:hypothetical protein